MYVGDGHIWLITYLQPWMLLCSVNVLFKRYLPHCRESIYTL